MEFSIAAIMSLVALAVVVIISCVNEDLNVGYLSVGFAIIVGGLWGGLKGAEVLKGWPLDLFMILIGVTFLFGIARTNGTMEKVTAYSLRVCKGNTMLVPFIIFVLVTFITTIGPGNIAGCALLAPVAMAIATRIGMPAFLMTLLVVGAANGAAFSPFAPTGIISNGIIAKMAPALGITNLDALAWKIHFNSEVAQGLVNIGGFFLMGGWAWIMKQKGQTINIDELAPKPEPFDKAQLQTLAAVFILILAVVLPGLPAVKLLLKGSPILNLVSNVGTVAFILSGFLMLTGAGDSEKAVKAQPWAVIIMVCGVSVLIDVMDKSGGLNALVKMIGAISNPITVNAWLGLFTGVISAYSSSSGVVMPMFLPLVPGLIKEIGGGNAVAMISSINIGSHLVDTSPLSTLGALCIACAGEHEDKAKLFRKLLMWGLAMAVVGAAVCWLFFGILNF